MLAAQASSVAPEVYGGIPTCMLTCVRVLCRYSIGKILGAGSFGVVREAVHLATHRRWAHGCSLSPVCATGHAAAHAPTGTVPACSGVLRCACLLMVWRHCITELAVHGVGVEPACMRVNREVTRQLTRSACWRRYACKTIPKIPKRGQGTPRYLLKLQTEVDAMQQLGPSFDAVSLKVLS